VIFLQVFGDPFRGIDVREFLDEKISSATLPGNLTPLFAELGDV
jgi:hypothetical protein